MFNTGGFETRPYVPDKCVGGLSQTGPLSTVTFNLTILPSLRALAPFE